MDMQSIVDDERRGIGPRDPYRSGTGLFWPGDVVGQGSWCAAPRRLSLLAARPNEGQNRPAKARTLIVDRP